MADHASDLKGLVVMSREEGARLGTVLEILIDTQAKRLAGLTFRTRPIGGEERYVPIKEIQIIGRDMVLVSGEQAAIAVVDSTKSGTKSLKDLQGCAVVTTEGSRLGTLVDLDFDRSDWSISELMLAEERHLAVKPQDLALDDDIIIPAALAARVQSSAAPKTGLLGRAFGAQAIQDAREIIARALRRKDRPQKGDNSNSAG